MDKEALLSELKKAYDDLKKKYGLKADFEEVDSFFYLSDQVFYNGFVSGMFRDQLISRMVDSYSGWLGLLHSWVLPNAHDYVGTSESKLFSDDERKEIRSVFKKIIYFVRKSKIVIFSKPEQTSDFVNEMIDFKNNVFVSFIDKYHSRLVDFWQKEEEESGKRAPDYL